MKRTLTNALRNTTLWRQCTLSCNTLPIFK